MRSGAVQHFPDPAQPLRPRGGEPLQAGQNVRLIQVRLLDDLGYRAAGPPLEYTLTTTWPAGWRTKPGLTISSAVLGPSSTRSTATRRSATLVVRDPQMAISSMAGSRSWRSPGSEVTTCCPVRRAQITTWASTMSDVPLAASSLPTFVASTRSRSVTSVVGWRTRRASLTCRSGRRIACQRGRRNRDAGTRFPCAGKQDHNAAVIPVQRDQAASIKGHAGHQATDLPPMPSTSSAQARSLSDSAPPVSRSASASRAPHPATSSRATATACCTNPDTLAAVPAATRARIRSSCASSRVTVTFLAAIPITIPVPHGLESLSFAACAGAMSRRPRRPSCHVDGGCGGQVRRFRGSALYMPSQAAETHPRLRNPASAAVSATHPPYARPEGITASRQVLNHCDGHLCSSTAISTHAAIIHRANDNHTGRPLGSLDSTASRESGGSAEFVLHSAANP
jgi:hypothetical protein